MMTIRFTASRLLVAAACAGALLSAPMIPTPIAQAACSGMTDPVTGVCWTGSAAGSGVSGTGGTCLPGRLGLCLGALANSQMPGDNLPDNTVAGPSRTPGGWP